MTNIMKIRQCFREL